MGTGVDALPYVDALIKEYLLFRGFTSTLSAFTKDLAADPGCGFQAERITDLIFRQLIPSLDCQQLVEFLEYLNMQLYSRLDSRYEPLVSAVEADLLRLLLVTAHKAGRPDCMAEFFKLYGPQLVSNSSSRNSSNNSSSAGAFGSPDAAADWREWFLLPYLQNPEKEQRFQLYFSSEWSSLLEVSFRNFIAGVVRSLPLPAVLRFNTDRRLRLALQQQVHALQSELERTKEQLDAALGNLQQQQQQQQQQQLEAASDNQQQQHQQVCVPDPSLHRREASLGDWQHKLQAGKSSSSSCTGPVALQQHSRSDNTGAAAATAAAAAPAPAAVAADGSLEGRELQEYPLGKPPGPPRGGSGLFELLPQHSGALSGGGSGAAATASGVLQHTLHPAGKHVRGTSFSGSISFDALSAVAAEGQAEGDGCEGSAGTIDHSSEDEPHVEQQQKQQSRLTPHAHSRASRSSSSISSSRLAAAPPPALATANLAVSPSPRSNPTPRSSSSANGLPLSSSPVMSWAGGSSSSTGVRPRHIPTGHAVAGAGVPGSGTGSTSGGATTAPQAAPVAVQVLSAAPPDGAVAVSYQKHQSPAADVSSGTDANVVAVVFSPSGANVASVVGGSSTVHIWSPAGVTGNAARAAVVSCGARVTCVGWDSRADKLMLIGCAAAGGVRAWHADTRRIMDSVPAEPGFPVVAAVAACPSEPTFVVAANSGTVSTISSSAGGDGGGGGGGAQQVYGRLVTYNARSFKRSSVLSVPADSGLVSVAYSSSGSQLLVGTAVGTALLYEPNSRSSPVRVWDVAAAVAQQPAAAAAAAADGGSSTAGTAGNSVHGDSVHVLWRPLGKQSSSSSSGGGGGSGNSGSGTVLTLCAGVLCEWVLSAGGSSRAPIVALDVLTAAKDALSGLGTAVSNQQQPHQQQQDEDEDEGTGTGDVPMAEPVARKGVSGWHCTAAVSPDGNSAVVLCSGDAAGVLLLLSCTAATAAAASAGKSAWGQQARVLLQGNMLSGQAGNVSWHPGGTVVVVGGAGGNSITVDLLSGAAPQLSQGFPCGLAM